MFIVLVPHVAELLIGPTHKHTVTNQKGIILLSHSHPPTHSLPHTLQANWESPLADLPSYTERVIAMTAESCSLSPTRVGLVRVQTARTHLTDITAKTESLLPRQPQLGNRNLATSHSTGDWLGEQCSERWIRRSIIVSLGAEGHAGSELCQTLRGWWTHWNNDDSPDLNLA